MKLFFYKIFSSGSQNTISYCDFRQLSSSRERKKVTGFFWCLKDNFEIFFLNKILPRDDLGDSKNGFSRFVKT